MTFQLKQGLFSGTMICSDPQPRSILVSVEMTSSSPSPRFESMCFHHVCVCIYLSGGMTSLGRVSTSTAATQLEGLILALQEISALAQCILRIDHIPDASARTLMPKYRAIHQRSDSQNVEYSSPNDVPEPGMFISIIAWSLRSSAEADPKDCMGNDYTSQV